MYKDANESVIPDDVELLELMVGDAGNAAEQYQPGPYWKRNSVHAAKELARYGLAGFRGADSFIANSFGDNTLVNLRTSYRSGKKNSLKLMITKLPGFKQVFEGQAKLTEAFFRTELIFKNEYLRSSKRVQELIVNYSIVKMDTTRGDCVGYVDFNGSIVSHHYLNLLNTLDVMMRDIGRKSLTGMTILEIGGGFGANTHLMVNLFGARKILYLDISPNLYVGTQYLKSFYGESVIDYRESKNGPIRFRSDDSLEIFCILPHQIENIEAEVNLFYNAHSFVEMPKSVVRNYASKVSSLLSIDLGIVYLVSYDGFDPSTSLDPNFLTTIFERFCLTTTVETLTPGRQNFHFYFAHLS